MLIARLNHIYHSRMLQRRRAAKYAAIPDQVEDMSTEDVPLDHVTDEALDSHVGTRAAVEALA